MTMSTIITSDLHLTLKPLDQYRWGIFPYLSTRVRLDGHKAVIIAGDLTDQKDKHPARLVNSIVREITSLASIVPVWILMGNHDYVNRHDPFFGFLNYIPNVNFITLDCCAHLWKGGPEVAFIPHRHDWTANKFVAAVRHAGHADLVCLHQTIQGAEDGSMTLHGFPRRWIDVIPNDDCAVVSGDVHQPQKCGRLVYVGAPYPVRFGDHYQPRVLTFDGETLKSRKCQSVRKISMRISSLADMKKYTIEESDQVRTVVTLHRADFGKWSAMKLKVLKRIKKLGGIPCGIELREAERVTLKKKKGETEAINPADTLGTVERYCNMAKTGDELEQYGTGIALTEDKE